MLELFENSRLQKQLNFERRRENGESSTGNVRRKSVYRINGIMGGI